MQRFRFIRMLTLSILSLSLMLWVCAAAAQQPVSMGEIQNAANRSGDKSMALLELVFGPVVHNPLAGLGSGGSMIAQMFAVLTGCMLAVGIVWALYHFVAAMIATGQSGEFLGERKSSPWYVIRGCAGFSALIPMFGGYCGAQILMLWSAMMGVGIANLTTDAAIAVLKSGGSMVATPVSAQATTLSKALFEANLCAVSVNASIAKTEQATTIPVDPAEHFKVSSRPNKVVLTNARGLSCGGAEMTITEPPSLPSYGGMVAYAPKSNALYERLRAAHQNALSDMEWGLAEQAQRYVRAIDNELKPPFALDVINAAARRYEKIIQRAIQTSSGSINALSNLIESNLKRDGWIMMGAWYQTFAQANAQATNMANATAAGLPGTDPDLIPYSDMYQTVAVVYAHQMQQAASISSTQQQANDLSVGTTDPKSYLSRIFPGQKLVQMAIHLNSGQGPVGMTNPLIGMKNLGDYILDAGWASLGIWAGLKAAIGVSKSNGGKLLGLGADIATGGAYGIAKGAVSGVLSAIAPFVVMMVVALFFFGATLSIYVPMLPFIIWFGGVVSWFAVVGEAMIAAPLWAMTHLDGEGEGMGPRTAHGYIFLLNVMFRPVFMIIGFVLAGAGVMVLGTLLNTMFGVAMQNAQYDSTTGIVSILCFIVLYVGMCLTLCNTCFGLINVVPDQVLAWIGGSMSSRVGTDMDDKTKAHHGQAVSLARAHVSPMQRVGGGRGVAAPAGASSQEVQYPVTER